MNIRSFLSNFWFIHAEALLGLLAFWGYLSTGNKVLIFLVLLSTYGAVCGSFIKVIDTIQEKK